MSRLSEQYNISSGGVGPGGFTSFTQHLVDSGTSARWLANFGVKVEPGAWAKVGDTTYQNDTDDTQTIDHTEEVDEETTEVEIQFGLHIDAPEPKEAGSVQLNSLEPNMMVFSESFPSLVSFDPGESDPEMPQPSGYLEADNLWDLGYLGPESLGWVEDDGFEWVVDDGLTFTLDRSDGFVERGFRLTSPNIEAGNTNILLSTRSENIEFYNTGPEGEIQEEFGYWGIWVYGAAPAYTPLWVDLSVESQYSMPLPDSDPVHGNTDYSYIKPGVGEHEVDLSQYDDILGGGVFNLIFEATIIPGLM